MSRLYQAPLMLWSLAFVAGVGVAEVDSGWLPVALFVAAATSGLSASRVWRHRPEARLTIALLLLTPLALAAGAWRLDQTRAAAPAAFDLQSEAVAEQPLTVIGVVTAQPRRTVQRIELRVRAEQIRLADEQTPAELDLLVRLPLATSVAIGDRVEVVGFTQLRDAERSGNWSDYVARARVSAIGEATSARVIGHGGVSWTRRALNDARDAMNRSLARTLPPPLAGVAQGMITGSRDSLDRPLREDFNATGLSHLIVISGSNVTLLATIVISVTAWLVGRRGSGLLAILAASGYCVFVGADAPVLRATVMAVVFVIAHMLGRPAAAPYAIMLAAAAMIAQDPRVLVDISFQLSFAGTLAIAALSPTLSQRFLSGEGGLRSATMDLVLINIVAIAATMPLIALHFERVSLVSLPANLVTAPFFAWMFLGGLATGVVGMISEGLGSALAWPLAWLPLRWFTLVGQSLADWPGAQQTVPGFGHIHVIAIYAALALIAIRPDHELLRPSPARTRAASRAAPVLAAGLLAAAGAAVWLVALDRDEHLEVHFLDVGQGDATVIHTPAGHSILIDGGADADRLASQLRDALPSGERRLDLVIVTHPQLDHLGGVLELFGGYEIGQIVVSPVHDDAALGRRMRELAEEHGVPVVTATAGTRIVLPGTGSSPDLILDVLWPLNVPAGADENLNAHSLTIRLRYGEFAALLPADIGVEQEFGLAAQVCQHDAHDAEPGPCDLTAAVLKVPHHGSGGSTSDLLLRRVRPSLAAISAGASNPHGHPHPDVIALLERHEIATLQTATHGRITIVTDGAAIVWTTER